jgi:hypothetical protein
MAAVPENDYQRKSREKYVKRLFEIQKRAQGKILDQVETAIIAVTGKKESFLPLKSRINKYVMDAARSMQKELEDNYSMEYVSYSEEIIQVKR